MNYTPGPYTPFPISGERSETPPPDFDPTHPFTGVELTVSGLPYTSLTSAVEHLNQIIHKIVSEGTELPDLQIVSPATRKPLDFVYVSLVGVLKETPRPDILETVRLVLDAQENIEARWKVSSGRTDKTRQVYFETDQDLNPIQLKTRIDNILAQNHYSHQSSYIPGDSNRIFYHFIKRDSITSLTNTPIMIDNRSYIPHRSRHIQPLYGLEIAINGVGDAQSAKSIIDSYLERRYGDFVGDTVVRRSRVELDGSVYCAILATPQVTQRFLRDPFTLFENSGFTTSPPQFLYLLNSAGIPPTSFTNRFSSSTSIDPTAQRQLDGLSNQCETMAATIRSISDDQKMLGHNFQIAQDNITRAFADSTSVYAASNLFTAAQFELSSLQQTLTTLQLMSVMAQTDVAQRNIQDSIQDVSSRIATGIKTRDQCYSDLRALQTRALPMPSASRIPTLTPSVSGPTQTSGLNPDSTPTTPQTLHVSEPSHKRMRTSSDDGSEPLAEESEVDHIAAQMQVDDSSQPQTHEN